MNTATKKAIIIKSDNKPYASFNAYLRPKRSNTSYRKPENVKIVNLDPTDDPSKVCEAYRQIRIRAQYRRIAKNEARLAEKRRLAEAQAAKAAAKEAQRLENKKKGIAKSVQSKRESSKGIRARNRQKAISDALIAGAAINLKTTTLKRCQIEKEVAKLRSFGHDIVSITSAGGQRASGLSVSIYAIDAFKRPNENLNDNYAISQADVEKIIIKALQQGLIIKTCDIRSAPTTIRKAIAQLRLNNWPICVVKNRSMDVDTRGWILPCEANGLKDIKDVKVE